MGYTEKEFQAMLKNPAVRIAGTRPIDNVSIKPVDRQCVDQADIPKRGKPNKTESEAGVMLGYEFPGCKLVFEGITLRLDCGMAYTGDWNVHLPDGKILIVEVKNAGYKHPSYGRSKMAFNQCKIDYPMFSYRWMVKNKSEWNIT